MTHRDIDEPRVLEIADSHRLNHETGDAYPQSLYRAVPEGPAPALAVDLGAVDLLSSRGLRILVNLKRRVERGQGQIVLFRLKPSVRDQLRRTSLAPHFPSAPDRRSAVELLRSARSV